MGAALGLAAWARTRRVAMPGVRATATRHSSGGCGAGLGFGDVGGRGAGKRGRAGGCAALSRSGDRRERLADDARERGRGGGEKRKKGGAAVGGSVAERAMRRRRAGGREPGSRAIGRKGKADGWGPPVSCPGRKGGEGVR
jgi:hypothetical protein